MNKTQLIILWIGALVFLLCLWNPEDIFDFRYDDRSICLLSIAILTALLMLSNSDKNKDKFKEILKPFIGSRPKKSKKDETMKFE
ncbi:MAG: hypothetical protein JXB18_11620 [Sedimentisphaerales bacterium]|nr:hypothetical protein [Sedimentisphaerales bacterium]